MALAAALPALGSALTFGGNGFTEVFYAFDNADTVLFADSSEPAAVALA
jgi:hypothetical protein